MFCLFGSPPPSIFFFLISRSSEDRVHLLLFLYSTCHSHCPKQQDSFLLRGWGWDWRIRHRCLSESEGSLEGLFPAGGELCGQDPAGVRNTGPLSGQPAGHLTRSCCQSSGLCVSGLCLLCSHPGGPRSPSTMPSSVWPPLQARAAERRHD